MFANINSLIDDLVTFPSQRRLGTESHQTQRSGRYYHNYAFSTLVQFGFKELDKKSYREQRVTQDGLYVVNEPNGSQKAPDILLTKIRDSKIVNTLGIEVKSGNKKIFWNDGIPQEDVLYMYYDYKLRKSLLVSGKHLIPEKDRILMMRFKQELRELTMKYKKEVSKNFSLYARKANQQKIELDRLPIQEYENITKESAEILIKFLAT